MLISGELYQALREAGAGDEKAMDAAALLATQEMRLRKTEASLVWIKRFGVAFAFSATIAAVLGTMVAVR